MKERGLENRINSFSERIHREDVNLHGFILTVDGQEKVRAYYEPFQEGEPHRMYSVSKTMVACAIGMLMEEGRISPEDHIVDFFRDLLPEEVSPYLAELTIRDMLRMATCYRVTAYQEYVDEDWTRPFFTGKPDHAPGTVFNYDTGCSQVLSSLVRRLSGTEVIDFLEKRLFTPLGCEDRRFWLRDPSGQCTGGTGLCMSLRDLNRVALCLMNGGEGLVPSWYIREMTRKQIDTFQRPFDEERLGYGWQCWQTRAGWSMYGMGGQLCIVCPEKDVLLTTIADTRLDWNGVQKIYDAFFEEVLPYTDTEDMDPVLFSLTVRRLEDRPEYGIGAAGPYAFGERNTLRMTGLSLRGNTLTLERPDGVEWLSFLPGEYLETTWPGHPEESAVVTSGWSAPGQLRLRCHAVGNAPCGFEMLLCFREETATVQCFRSHDPLTDDYEGVASGVKRKE